VATAGANIAKRNFPLSLTCVKLAVIKNVQNLSMSDFSQNDRTSREVVSAVNISQELTAQVDAWAEARGMARSDAICRLVELGLNSRRLAISRGSPRRAPSDIEHLAEAQIDKLLDPGLPASERERRIRRLTEGPPEFSDKRIDLAKRRE
jgi:hypothetical protein